MKTIIKKLMVAVLAVGSLSLLGASDMYIFQTTDVKIDNSKGKLYIGTPVKVLKDVDNKNALVELSGVAFGDKLYTNKNRSLIIASIEGGSFGQEGEAKKITAVIEKGFLLDNVAEIWEEHEEFYYDNCTQCHAAHEPKTHSMLEWDAILQTMNGFAQLYPDEAEYLARFVKATSNNGFYAEKKEEASK